MAKYKVKNTNILHNGELKKIGDIIELTDNEAEKLADVLVPVKETAKTDTNKNTTKNNKTTKTEDDDTQKDGETK